MTLTILPNNTNSDMIELTTSDSRGRRTLWAVAHADMFGDAQAISRRLYDWMPCVLEVRLAQPEPEGGAT